MPPDDLNAWVAGAGDPLNDWVNPPPEQATRARGLGAALDIVPEESEKARNPRELAPLSSLPEGQEPTDEMKAQGGHFPFQTEDVPRLQKRLREAGLPEEDIARTTEQFRSPQAVQGREFDRAVKKEAERPEAFTGSAGDVLGRLTGLRTFGGGGGEGTQRLSPEQEYVLGKQAVAGGMIGYLESQAGKEAQARFQAGQATKEDIDTLAKLQVQQARDSARSVGRKAVDMAAGLPAFLAEWSMLSGPAKYLSEAAGGGPLATALIGGGARTLLRPDVAFERSQEQGGGAMGALKGVGSLALENVVWSAFGGPAPQPGESALGGAVKNYLRTQAAAEINKEGQYAVTGQGGSTLHRFLAADTSEKRNDALADLAAEAAVFGGLAGIHGAHEKAKAVAEGMKPAETKWLQEHIFDSLSPEAGPRPIANPAPPEPSSPIAPPTVTQPPPQEAPGGPPTAPQPAPAPAAAPAPPTPPTPPPPKPLFADVSFEDVKGIAKQLGLSAKGAKAEVVARISKSLPEPFLRQLEAGALGKSPPEAPAPPPGVPQEAPQAPPPPESVRTPPGAAQTPQTAPPPPEAPQETQAPPVTRGDFESREKEFNNSGLSERQKWVMHELAAGRDMDSIAADPQMLKKNGKPMRRQGIDEIKNKALEKLPEDYSTEAEQEATRKHNVMYGIESGARVARGELSNVPTDEEKVVRGRMDEIRDIDRKMSDLSKKWVKLGLAGKLTPEKEQELHDEFAALDNRRKGRLGRPTPAPGQLPDEASPAEGVTPAEPDRGGGRAPGGPGGPDQAEAGRAGSAPVGPEAGARGAGAPEPAGGPAPVAAPPPMRGEAVDPGLRLAKELAGEEGGAVDVSAMTQHARNAYDHLKRLGQFLKDTAGKLAGRQVPATNRLSPKAADTIVRYDASRGLAEEQARYYPEVVLGKAGVKDEAFARTVGTAILEERARDAKGKLNDRSRESLAAAAELVRKSRAAGITPEEKQRLLDAAARHETEGKKDAADAGKIITFVGHPDSPFKVEADYQAALVNPEVKAATERYDKEYVPERERAYRESKGLDQDAEPTITQRDRGTISAYQPEEVSPPPGPGVHGQGYLGNPKVRGLSTSRDASLQGKTYETDIRKIIRNDVLERTPKAAKAEMVRALVSEGLAKWGMNGQTGILFGDKPAVEFPEVAPPPGTQSNLLMGPPKPGYASDVELGPGQKALFVHPDVAPDVRQVLKVDESPGRIPYVSRALGAVTSASLVGAGGEVTTHEANLISMLSKAGHNPVDFFRRAYEVITRDPQMQRDWLELTRIGATKRVRGLESGELYESKYNPLTLSGRALDFIDKTTRLTASDAFDRMAGDKGLMAKILPESVARRVENTEQNKRDFINQVGNYSKGTQSRLAVFLRNSGFGPFATAGTNFTAQGVRAVFGGSGVTATSYPHAVGLRVETYLRLMAPVAAALAYNFLRWGRVDGDDNTPIGAVKVGVNPDTKETNYIDVTAAMNPLRRGMRMTGLNAVMEGTRAGASNRSIKGQAWHEAISTASHPFLGPGGQFLYTAGTGKDALGRQVAYQPDEEGSELGENVKAAVKGVSPLYSPEEYLRTGQVQKYHEHPFLEQLGPYRIKQSKQPPGHEQKPKGLRRP